MLYISLVTELYVSMNLNNVGMKENDFEPVNVLKNKLAKPQRRRELYVHFLAPSRPCGKLYSKGFICLFGS